MDKILAKQVENMVDQSSEQQIGGEKTFTTAVFDAGANSHHMVNFEGFIYWTTNTKSLNQDGNYRMGMIEGFLRTQQYSEGMWNTI